MSAFILILLVDLPINYAIFGIKNPEGGSFILQPRGGKDREGQSTSPPGFYNDVLYMLFFFLPASKKLIITIKL